MAGQILPFEPSKKYSSQHPSSICKKREKMVRKACIQKWTYVICAHTPKQPRYCSSCNCCFLISNPNTPQWSLSGKCARQRAGKCLGKQKTSYDIRECVCVCVCVCVCDIYIYIYIHTHTILPKVLGHPFLMKGLTTSVISMSSNLNV